MTRDGAYVIVVFCMCDYIYITDSNSFNFDYIFGNFGLYWGVPEGRKMSTIKYEEALYQNLKNLSWRWVIYAT